MPAGNMRFAAMLADRKTMGIYVVIIQYQADVILLGCYYYLGHRIFHSAAVKGWTL